MRLYSSYYPATIGHSILAVTTLSVTSLISACNDNNNNGSADLTGNTGATVAAVRFAPKVDAEDFSCGSTYNIGGNDYRVDDFRLYVHDVTLTTDIGDEIPVTLTQDGQWQYENVAHLDFENATQDSCNGNDETNNTITGTYEAPTEGNINGICFNLGVPYEYNHELTSQNTTSPAPLNVTGMSWVWLGGHKFLKVDGVGDPGGTNTNFHVHVGSTGCYNDDIVTHPFTHQQGSNINKVPDFQCSHPNTPRVCLSNFNMDSQDVTIDLAALLADSDVTVNNGGAAGCMSGNDDPECPTIMPKLGINFVADDGVNPVIPYPAIEPQPVFGMVDK